MLLDIMMPYYGDMRQMRIAVESIMRQDSDRWRLTVVDDDTIPGVPEWFASLRHSQIRYIRNERNLGVTANFQKCLEMAEYDHVVIMGCDDIMLPGYVSCVVNLLHDHPDATIIQPGVSVIDGLGSPRRTLVDSIKKRVYAPRFSGVTTLSGEDLAVSLLRGDWLYFPSLCWQTAAVQKVGFDLNLHTIQDLALVLQLVQDGAKLVVSDTRCFLYRRHAVSASSISAAAGTRFSEAQRFFRLTADHMQARGWARAARAARHHYSSRLHALTLVPSAIRSRNRVGLQNLIAYSCGRPI